MKYLLAILMIIITIVFLLQLGTHGGVPSSQKDNITNLKKGEEASVSNGYAENIKSTFKHNTKPKIPYNHAINKTTAHSYENSLNNLLRNSNNLEERKLFIKSNIKSITPKKFFDIVDVFKNNTDERSEKRIISSTILSEIESDTVIDLFYQEIIESDELLADFVSATYYTNTQNSFNKLMDAQNLNISSQSKRDVEQGTLMMYQGSVTRDTYSHINEWLSNQQYISQQQENVIIGLTLQLPYNYIKEITINHNFYKFSEVGQQTLRDRLKSIPIRD